MGIQAAIRQHIHRNQHGGNLLKAEGRNSQVDQAHVAVTFTGTRSDDKRTGHEPYESFSHKLGLLMISCKKSDLKLKKNRTIISELIPS